MIFNVDNFQYVDHYVKNENGDKVREIIALAKYHGKTYRGKARCHPDDTFDLDIGKELAARRCDLAIRKARLADRNQAVYDVDEFWGLMLNIYKKANSAKEEYKEAMDHYLAFTSGLIPKEN